MARKIDFPADIEELRVKYKVGKTNMQKFLESCGELETVAEYCEKIEAEYGHDHVCDDPAPTVSEGEVILGYHPITGAAIYR